MTARVLVVEHEGDAGIGLVGERMRKAGLQLVTVGPESGVEIPMTAEGYDAVVVLGGTPGPTDDDVAPWLPGVRSLMADALAREVPMLGICLGAQLLAVVAGGRVDPVRHGAELGLTGMSLTESGRLDPLLHDLAGDLVALQWHYLEVHELPPGSVSLCASDRCANQAFRVGEAAWGLQFHLEALADAADQWAVGDAAGLHVNGLDRSEVVAAMRANDARLRALWSEVADRWSTLVEDSRLARGTAIV